MARDVFNSIPVPRVGRNFFNLSYTKQFNCDAGQIIPIFCSPFIPGDHFKIGNSIVVRPQPMIAPIMSEVNVFTYYFAISNRILLGEMIDNEEGFKQWEIADRRWEKYISGGITGNITAEQIDIPRWMPTFESYTNDNATSDMVGYPANVLMSHGNTSEYSLWDYFGFPINLSSTKVYSPLVMPVIFPKRAYNMIYNWYFRDKNLEPNEVDLDSEKVLNCCWQKDYFTSALPWTQRGTSDFVALPVNITADDQRLSLAHNFEMTQGRQGPYFYSDVYNGFLGRSADPPTGVGSLTDDQSIALGLVSANKSDAMVTTRGSQFVQAPYLSLFRTLRPTSPSSDPTILTGNSNTPIGISSAVSVPNHSVPYSNIASHLIATTFDINDLRLASRVQQWLERNAIAGSDYGEFILAHYGVAPRDERLQKPLFLGSSKNPLWISEVLQTSSPSSKSDNGSPLGSLGGHGLTAGSNYICRYSAKEFGWIVGLMIIKPKPIYSQGIPRFYQYNNRFEYPFPEFTHLGEQDIRTSELGIYGSDYDIDTNTSEPRIFGYTGRFNELRYMHNQVCGGLRPESELSYWIWSRYFDVFNPVTQAPKLNNDFVKMRPDKSIFAVQDEPSFVVSVNNICHSWRPLPKYPTPEVI